MSQLCCPVCGSGQVRTLDNGSRRCRRCGYDDRKPQEGIAKLQPCPKCNSEYMLVRYNGTVICRTCKTSYTIEMEPTTAPVPIQVEKTQEQLKGAARIQQLIREAKARTSHPIIRPTPIPQRDEEETSIK